MRQLKKKEKKMLIALGVVVIVSAISLYNIYKPDKGEPEIISEATESSTPKQNTPKTYSSKSSGKRRGGVSAPSRVAGISMSEFQKHAKIKDCWVLIDGEVYNISGFIQAYPSYKDDIADFCGTVGFEAGFLAENKIRDTIKSKSQKMGIIG